MNPMDENVPHADPASQPGKESTPEEPLASPLAGVAADVEPPVAPAPPPPTYPEDLEITWSWPHFIVFIVFGFISLMVVQGVLASFLVPHRHMSPKDLEKYLISDPKFSIGSMLIWYATLFFFLYVTLSLLRGYSFWRCLGWRKIRPRLGELPKNPGIYFIAGCGLSLFVALASAQMKTPENIPMEELFKVRETAILFMAMAVLVAPLVEETLFRGYLYPLFARSFGIAPGIVLTGVLFGLMHGAQLGWTWGLVAMLIFVGIVFTIVRARTGSVFASYLMHLGYNSLISFFAVLGTHGFTKLPGQ
jgi:membrane protease YdiL (CAAX protease family)